MSSTDDPPKTTLSRGLTTPATPSPEFAATAPLSPPAFAEGDLISGRYKVVRFLAGGGMGQVFEAEDLLLHERMALKTIHSNVSRDQRAVERFKREIQLARRVTHENVCRIFDVGIHEPGSGQPGIAFLSMELLTGQTLADHIRKEGPLPLDEARGLLVQLVAGLGAAHRVGVVHRDFKSSNVILVREGERTRAVVTDFGLARHATGSKDGASVTGTGDIVGSPHYMAPEQVEGGEITPAVDVYALGVVLYEMVTGDLPFQGESALAVAVKRLKEDPPSPRKRRPDLDARWESAILRCLERQPSRRFAQVGDLLRVLEGKPIFKRRWLVAAAAALVVAGALVWRLGGGSRNGGGAPAASAAAESAQAARRAVAVVGFRNAGGRAEDAWLSGALAEMLASELGAGEGLRTIPGESVARMKKDLALADADGFGAETLARIRRTVSADFIVVGSYVVAGERVRLDARLQETRSGDTVLQVAETAKKDQLLELVAQAGSRLRAGMGAADLSAAERTQARATLPHHPDAQRAYSEGLARLRVGECKAAESALAQAVATEPEFALAQAKLSDAIYCLGREAESQAALKKARDLAAALPRRERLEIEAAYHNRTFQYDRALETYRTLFEFFPDVYEYGEQLAQTQLALNRVDEAAAVGAALRKLPAPDGDGVPVLLLEASLARTRGDLPAARAAITRAAEVAKARGEKAHLGLVRVAEGQEHLDDGDPAGALAAFQEMRKISEELEDRDGVAMALIAEGIAWQQRGELARARRALEDGVAIANEIGSRRRLGGAWSGLANVLMSLGDLPAAMARCEEVTTLEAVSAVPTLLAMVKRCHAGVLALRGDLAAAAQLLDELVPVLEKAGRPDQKANFASQRALLLLDRGDAAGARALVERSLGDPLLSGRQRADAQVTLTLIALDDGRAAEAVRLASGILESGVLGGVVVETAMLRSLLVHALVLENKPAEAQAALAPLVPLADKLEDLGARLMAAAAIARVRRDSASFDLLKKEVARVEKAGLVGFALRGRLALGQASGDPAVLAAVERDARARGFVTLARLAGARPRP